MEPKIIEGKFNTVTNEMTEGSLENPMKGPTGNQYYSPNKGDFEVAEFLKHDLISYMPPIPAFEDPMQQALDANLYSESLLKLYNEDIMDVYGAIKDCKYRVYDIHNKEVKDEEQYINLFQQAAEIRIVCKGD